MTHCGLFVSFDNYSVVDPGSNFDLKRLKATGVQRVQQRCLKKDLARSSVEVEGGGGEAAW